MLDYFWILSSDCLIKNIQRIWRVGCRTRAIIFQRTYCRCSMQIDAFPGATRGFVCVSWRYSPFTLGWEPQTSASPIPLWKKDQVPLRTPILGFWELGEWSKAQAVSAPQVGMVLFVDSLMWVCAQHINFLDNHSKTLNWYREGI